MGDRLYRSRDDRVIGGVAAGLADYLNVDPSLVRIVWVILALVSGGAMVLVYLVMLVVVPEEATDEFDWNRPFGAGPAGPAGVGVADTTTGTVADDTAPTTLVDTGTAPGTASGTLPPAPPPSAWQSPREQRRAERRARRAARRSAGPGEGALVIGVVLILLGGFFLLRQYIPFFDFGFIWPIVVIGLGVLLLVGSFRPGGRSGGRSEG